MANAFMDLQHQATLTVLLANAARTAQTTGTGVLARDSGTVYCSALLAAGVPAGSSPTQDVKIQESADNSSWSDCVKGDGTTAAFTQVTAATAEIISFKRQKPYVRAYAAAPGGSSTPGFTYGVYLIEQAKDWGGPGWTSGSTAGTTA